MSNLFGLLLLLLVPLAAATEGTQDSCQVIRARIGIAPLAEPDLLRALAARKDCAFTAAEVYRAAHGNQAPARENDRRRHRRHDEDKD